MLNYELSPIGCMRLLLKLSQWRKELTKISVTKHGFGARLSIAINSLLDIVSCIMYHGIELILSIIQN